MYHKFIYILTGSLTLIASAFFAGCNTEIDSQIDGKNTGIIFGARFEGNSQVLSRADDNPDIETLDSVYIASDPFGMDFYIQLNCEQPGGPDFTETATYVVRSGYEGQLVPKENTEPLDWHDLTSKHTFYAWNLPWEQEIEQPSLDPVPVIFYNSAQQDGFDDYQNNSYLENFVGAKSESYTYDTHGKYVDLTFFHLVSKIRLGSLILIKTDGSIQKDLKADVTFVGMPTQATFHPHPDDDTKSRNGMPYVGEPLTKSPDSGVTYFIDNNPSTEDWFYICPEIDFSEIDFKIKLTSDLYKDYDTYYGTFDDVEFERVPGSRYDNENGGDKKILHAGEMMTLNITLIPGVGPGMKIIISDWSTDKPKLSQFHSEAGFYSDEELADILGPFINLSTWPRSQEEWDEFYAKYQYLVELYGEEKDGERIFYLYDNLTATSNGSTISNICPIPPGFILDGMGHILRMKANYGVFPGNPPYFNIGPCRDIYLTDENGNNSIYIDAEGYVWISDPVTGAYTQTNNQLPPLEGNYKSYDINSVTGEIRPSEYFNNSIVK